MIICKIEQLQETYLYKNQKKMNIAVQGCMHGELDQIYHDLAELQKNSGVQIDALIICGDFQATRDEVDLDYMHCPPKYKSLGSFQKYYSGQKKVPYLTIFIGGNHEAVNYMRDLYFGGWVAPRIYYLGQAGSIYICKGEHKIRVSGLSGIYNDYDFKYCLRTQRIPLMGKSKVSCYHVKQIEIFRMELLARIQMMKKQDPALYGPDSSPFHIFLTHDWPKDIALYGKTEKLLQFKPFLKEEIDNGTLGSPPSARLLTLAQPAYWFSAHMHVKYAALFPHPNNKYTHFLSLDKCLKNRSCLQILKFTSDKNIQQCSENKSVSIELDRTWLWILKLTLNLQMQNRSLYKFEQNGKSIKILDPNLMNTLIKSFSEMVKNKKLSNCDKFEQNLIKWEGEEQKGTEVHQTIFLIEKVLEADPKIFNGIIFPREAEHHTISQMKQENPNKKADDNDEIQLDL